jgi:glucose-6-phosphate dehydrogenase assembly protein OpcA
MEETMSSEVPSAGFGQELPIDFSAIEKSLAELWRGDKDSESAVMHAALWNVVAHTSNSSDHSRASETLGRVSESVPQRAIIIRADLKAASDISSWISANCHRVGGEQQICCEEVSIVAGGARVRHIPPLVSALLIPDMPVAVWWVGDLPNDQHAYVETLLDPADRLIVDSSSFDSIADLVWLREISQRTFTAPADLNWVRLEDLRLATASLFDSPQMRARLLTMNRLRVTAVAGANKLFGDSIESLYYAAWLVAQVTPDRLDQIRCQFSVEPGDDTGAITQVLIGFEDGSEGSIRRDPRRRILIATIDGRTQTFDCVTRLLGRGSHELIVRQLKRPEADRVFVKALPIATELASRIR